MEMEQQNITKPMPDDTVRGYIGGSIRYRIPHTYAINGKDIAVPFGFIVEEGGKKKNLSANAVEEIVRLYDEDPTMREFLKNLPRVEEYGKSHS